MNVQRIKDWYRRNKRWFDLADSVLNALNQIKEDSIASKVAAMGSVGNSLVQCFIDYEEGFEFIHKRGYVAMQSPITRFVFALLGEPEEVERLPDGQELYFWMDYKILGINYEGDDYYVGPFLKDCDKEDVYAFISSKVWLVDQDLMLVENKKRRRRDYDLVPIEDPGPYISSEHDVDYFVSRIEKYGTVARTFIIEGPTGVGKSVLARHLASRLGGVLPRTLKVDGQDTAMWSPSELPEIIRMLQPSVVLLDDFNLLDNSREVLSVLEAVRVLGSILIVTRMVQTDRQEARVRGDRYVDGMRPGRIDEVFTLYPPNADDRRTILFHYFSLLDVAHKYVGGMDRMVELTKGFTGAYLAEVARRVVVHGLESLEKEIEEVGFMAPPLTEDEEQEDGQGSLRDADAGERVRVEDPD